MDCDPRTGERQTGSIAEHDLSAVLRAAVLQSPVSTCILDRAGTLIFTNQACQELVGVERDDEIVGKYNVFEDEEVIQKGFAPQIKRALEEGGAAEFLIDYEFIHIKHLTTARPAPRILRFFFFAIKDEVDSVQYAVVQHEDHTEKVRAERALAESEARYRAIIQASPDAITMTDLDTKVTFANREAAALVGFESAEEIVGRSGFDFFASEDLPLARENMRRILEVGSMRNVELTIVRKDGTRFPAELSSSAIKDAEGRPVGFMVVARDITERKQAQKAMQESEEKFRDLYDEAPIAYLSMDTDSRIRMANRSALNMLGYSSEDLIGRPVFDLYADTPSGRPKAEEFFRRFLKGEEIHAEELEMRTKDGRSVWISLSVRPIRDAEGRVVASRSMAVDITERKQAERREREAEEHRRDFYRRTILAATEGKLLISEREEIEKIAGLPAVAWEIARGEDLSTIRSEAAEFARSAGMEESRIFDFVSAVGEAITNAFKHASGGRASIHEAPGGLLFMVSDQGPGIEALTLPEVALKRGYTTAASLGMGYKTIIFVADKAYLATGPTGTTVAIEMQLQPVKPPPIIAGLPDTWR